MAITRQWHWEGYYCLLPLALIDDKEFAGILDKDQIMVARGRNVGTFVESIRKRHQQRVGSK